MTDLPPRSIADIRLHMHAERLADVREEYGISQARLAEFIGVPWRYVWRWETGGAAPGFDVGAKIQIWSAGRVTRLSFASDDELRAIYDATLAKLAEIGI